MQIVVSQVSEHCIWLFLLALESGAPFSFIDGLSATKKLKGDAGKMGAVDEQTTKIILRITVAEPQYE